MKRKLLKLISGDKQINKNRRSILTNKSLQTKSLQTKTLKTKHK